MTNGSVKYNESVAQKITKHHEKLSFQMGATTFSGDDPIGILELLQLFMIVCDQNGFSEAAAIQVFKFYLEGPA